MLEVGGWIATTCILTYLLTFKSFRCVFSPFFWFGLDVEKQKLWNFLPFFWTKNNKKSLTRNPWDSSFFFPFPSFLFFFFFSVFCLWCVVWCVWRMVEWFEQKKTWGDESCVRVFKKKKKKKFGDVDFEKLCWWCCDSGVWCFHTKLHNFFFLLLLLFVNQTHNKSVSNNKKITSHVPLPPLPNKQQHQNVKTKNNNFFCPPTVCCGGGGGFFTMAPLLKCCLCPTTFFFFLPFTCLVGWTSSLGFFYASWERTPPNPL